MDACNDIPQVSKSSGAEWINAEQAVELMTDPQFAESNMCIPEPMAINCFLNNVVRSSWCNTPCKLLKMYLITKFMSIV